VFAAVLALTLAACTPAEKVGTEAAETRPSTPAVKTFGPDGYGKLTIGITETAFVLPLAGHSGWIILFELEGDTVKFMSLGGPN
jgi:hypothetical protein